eukprot:scaffold32493_cov118-Isochrysis_galbana.AAC.5
MVKAVLSIRSSMKFGCLAWACLIFCSHEASEPEGKKHSSESSERMPVPEASISSTTFVLSSYVIASTLMPSFWYSARMDSKTASVNIRCSFSLAKLMHNCSSEFVGKHSKPKMSTAPMKKRPSSPEISESLIASTTKSKRREYRA